MFMRYKGQPIIYNGKNFILTLVKQEKETAPIVIGCTDFSINDPISLKYKSQYNNCTELALYFKDDNPEIKQLSFRKKIIKKFMPYKFGCNGLKDTATELAFYINEIEVPVILQFVCKSARMLFTETFKKYLKKREISIIALSVPFLGTKVIMKQEVKKALNCLEYSISEFFSSHHIIDDEIATSAKLGKIVVPECKNITIFSSTLSKHDITTFPILKTDKKIINLFFKFLGRKLEKSEGESSSNGFITLKSQESIDIPDVNLIRIYDSLANIFKNRHVKLITQNIIDDWK